MPEDGNSAFSFDRTCFHFVKPLLAFSDAALSNKSFERVSCPVALAVYLSHIVIFLPRPARGNSRDSPTLPLSQGPERLTCKEKTQIKQNKEYFHPSYSTAKMCFFVRSSV
ncbi:hypothetical protein FJTKL_04612 [Diaporthe vaccinii]|uniref:Uncharacterized protein n=1 Tax=Diaporthe vaccinii TaxID=105482 RepID=A0ABR4EZC3_9PEZI